MHNCHLWRQHSKSSFITNIQVHFILCQCFHRYGQTHLDMRNASVLLFEFFKKRLQYFIVRFIFQETISTLPIFNHFLSKKMLRENDYQIEISFSFSKAFINNLLNICLNCLEFQFSYKYVVTNDNLHAMRHINFDLIISYI